MVVLAARCFRLFLSNAGTRAVCQKLTYETDKFHNFAQLGGGGGDSIQRGLTISIQASYFFTFLRETVSWKSLAKALERVDR